MTNGNASSGKKCPLFCWFLLAIGCIAKPTGQEINHTYLGKVLGHSAVEVHRREGRPAPSSHAAIDVAHFFYLFFAANEPRNVMMT